MSKNKQRYVIGGILLAVTAIIGYVAYRTRAVPTPRRRWKKYDRPDAFPLDAKTCQQLQGIYTIEEGHSFFGNSAVIKCSYTVEDNKRVNRISLFCEKNGTYIIAEAKKLGETVLLSGHWRKAAANGSGIVWLEASRVQNKFVINGWFGNGDHKPTRFLTLHFQKPVPQKRPLQIIGHRGGARNVDFLHVSENTIDMMKMAAQLGANGVEIDVRMTKDNVPVIFHDSFLSIHTVKGKIYGGLIHNYSLKELKSIELRKGGQVPTLQECLDTILYDTPLEMVWLDIKKECDLEKIQKLQQRYMQRAEVVGRKLNIYIGIPDKAMLKCFKQMDDYRNIPSLTELSPDIAEEINAEIWAPQYTNGTQKENVEKIHQQGRLAFVWSLDSRSMIEYYRREGGFDGIVTNTPSVVAHWYYTSDSVVPNWSQH